MDELRIITDCMDIDKDNWTDFVRKHPNGNVFQTPEMYEVYQKTKNYEPLVLAVINSDKELVGILLAVIQKEYSGIIGKFTERSVIFGGPLVKDNNQSSLDFILKEYIRIIEKKAIYSQFRNLWGYGEREKEIFRKLGFIYEDHLDIIHDLSKSPDKQLIQMHKGRRKNIRRASRRGLVFRELNNSEDILNGYELIKKVYKKISLPIPDYSLFINSYKIMKDKEIVKFFVAMNEKQIIGLRVVLCFEDLIYDWYAGSSDDHLDKYPNDFLPWKIMEWGHNNGYKIFDFGGAGKPGIPYGVRDYKLKFGGKIENWGRFHKVHKPLLMRIGKTGLNIYKRFR